MAQLVEQLIRNQQVAGSSPATSSKKTPQNHAFLGEKLPDWKAAASLVRKIAENYKLPYYTLSPTYSVLIGRAHV